ncbi:MAG: PIN/TRAM domain-containing protein, partial [Peptostreptococcaceae bacterium]
MIRKIMRAFIGIAGFVLGFTTYLALMKDIEFLKFGSEVRGFIISIVLGIVFGIMFYILEPWVIRKTKELVKVLDTEI